MKYLHVIHTHEIRDSRNRGQPSHKEPDYPATGAYAASNPEWAHRQEAAKSAGSFHRPARPLPGAAT